LFAGASGLVTKVDKCVITPIHCSQPQVDAVRQVFPCWVQDFPTKYLGTPLSLTRIRRIEEQRLVDAVAARLPMWKGRLLTDARRVTLTQTTLSAIPVHVSICCCLSTWAIDEIDRRRRAFLGVGSDSVSGGRCKIAWPIVCAPKDHGGLGLPDLRTLGYALCLRWEWLRRTEPDSAWALLPSAAERKVRSMFSVSITIEVGDGSSTRFWMDAWLPDGVISTFAPKTTGTHGQGRLVQSPLGS
jgi:hypothetical protein